MTALALPSRDRKELRSRGILLEEIRRQTWLINNPPPAPEIIRPCSVGDGIEAVSPARQIRLIRLAERAIEAGRVSKFVPASGAATRLFPPQLKLDPLLEIFLGRDLHSLSRRPKGLIPFHQVGREIRTAFEEHLWEAIPFADRKKRIKAHFTVGKEFLDDFKLAGKHCARRLQKHYGVRLHLTFSVQNPATDTIAQVVGDGWARRDDGTLLFRPGGHGALLGNLQATGGDLVFIKNIDNVPHPLSHSDGNRWRKIMAGRLMEIQTEAESGIKDIQKNPPDSEAAAKAERFILDVLEIKVSGHSPSERRDQSFKILNRPWRVCGMVQNKGEHGGGPFWVKGQDGPLRQILEGSQLGKSKKKLMEKSTHFNPVDLVVGLKDWKGRRFDLTRFTDPSQVIVSKKHFEGREIMTLEHPGLWNGGMANWNTLFMEVPLKIFHPVKTINDLVRPGHRKLP